MSHASRGGRRKPDRAPADVMLPVLLVAAVMALGFLGEAIPFAGRVWKPTRSATTPVTAAALQMTTSWPPLSQAAQMASVRSPSLTLPFLGSSWGWMSFIHTIAGIPGQGAWVGSRETWRLALGLSCRRKPGTTSQMSGVHTAMIGAMHMPGATEQRDSAEAHCARRPAELSGQRDHWRARLLRAKSFQRPGLPPLSKRFAKLGHGLRLPDLGPEQTLAVALTGSLG